MKRVTILFLLGMAAGCAQAKAESEDIDAATSGELSFTFVDGGLPSYVLQISNGHAWNPPAKGYVKFMADEDIRIVYDGKTVQLRDLMRDVARLKREVRKMKKARAR